MRVFASFPGFPHFFFLFSVWYTEAEECPQKRKAWEHLSHDVDIGGEEVPDYKFVHNKSERSFLSVSISWVSGVLPGDQAFNDEV